MNSLWPEGSYRGRPIRIDMRGNGAVVFEVDGRRIRVPLTRRGMNLPESMRLFLRHTKGREDWRVAR